nr:protein bric-a-brac 1-like [Leptinotarsa decemlineata]
MFFFLSHTDRIVMSDQQFVLRWHYHETTLIHNLPCFLESDVLTDVTLSVGSRQVKAHKIILAMCSVYFLQLFQEIKSSHPVVILHNVSFEEVKAILSFVYRGQCVVSQEQLPSLLSVAKMLRIQGLCDMKIPDDRHIRNDSSTNIDRVTETMVNEKKLKICDNLQNFRDRNTTESINIKRQVDNRLPIPDFNPNEAYKTQACFDDKAMPLINESIPMKFEDEPYALMKKFVPRDSPETCKCFLCGKYLSNQYNLRVHMETHEEAFHACQSCAHVSRSRDALRKHVSYRHPEEYQTRKRKKADT